MRRTITHTLPGTYLPNWLMKYARTPVATETLAPWLRKSVTENRAQMEWHWPSDEDVRASLPGYRPTLHPHGKQIAAAAKLITASARPILYVGGGVIKAEAHRELFRLATDGRLPVTTTLMARGVLEVSVTVTCQ